jgi:hypothetical protein
MRFQNLRCGEKDICITGCNVKRKRKVDGEMWKGEYRTNGSEFEGQEPSYSDRRIQ